MMAKLKKTRKQLLKEPDEFITFTGQLIRFGRSHYRKLLGGFTAFVVLLVIITSIRIFSEKGEAEASELFSEVSMKYEEALSSEGVEKALQVVEEDYKRLLSKHSDRKAGKQARFQFANIYFDAGYYDKAIELYKASLQDWENMAAIKNMVLVSLGAAYEQKEDYNTAVTYFERLRNSSASIGKADAMYSLGRIYAKLEETQKSMNAYEDVKKNHSDFMYSDIVKEKIQP